jgi:hypothetical protein
VKLQRPLALQHVLHICAVMSLHFQRAIVDLRESLSVIMLIHVVRLESSFFQLSS